MTDSPPPGQPGHGKDQGASINLHPGSLDLFDITCNACENDGTAYGRGPWKRELAKAKLEQHQGMNTSSVRTLEEYGEGAF